MTEIQRLRRFWARIQEIDFTYTHGPAADQLLEAIDELEEAERMEESRKA